MKYIIILCLFLIPASHYAQGKGEFKTINYDDGTYKGDVVLGKKHGNGIYTYKNGERYDGQYIDDKKEGYGEFYWKDGTIYKGQWKNGTMNGKGIYTNAKGKTYEGTFRNGKKKGKFFVRKKGKKKSKIKYFGKAEKSDKKAPLIVLGKNKEGKWLVKKLAPVYADRDIGPKVGAVITSINEKPIEEYTEKEINRIISSGSFRLGYSQNGATGTFSTGTF